MANKHTSAQLEWIVKRLAAFDTPRSIAAAFAAVHPGVPIHENDVLATDPAIAVVSPELYALYLSERERVLLDPDTAPFAKQQARLIVLSRQAEHYSNNNQPAEARAVFRQIAEELGVVAGKGGGGKAPAAAPDVPEIGSITRTIVDPPVVVPA